ncbi:glycosyltransferase [bacterium]|nr:glycosyltransferase [bacterium]
MRILALHRTQGHGVEAVHLRGMVDAMRAAGHAVALVGPPGADPYAPPAAGGRPGLAARFARRAPELLFELAEQAYDRRLAGRLAAAAARFQPELLYERYAFFGSAGGRLAARLGIPHVLEVNYTVADPLVRRRSGLLMGQARRSEAALFRRAALVAAVSSRLVQRVRAQGVAEARILLMPNAVHRGWWEAAAKQAPAALPARLAGEPVVGFVGGFYPWHGVDRLVEALRRCRAEGLPGKLLLVGDGPERPRIEADLAAAGLAQHALLTGALPHRELPAWIAAMDLCAMPDSNDYGSPMKVFEYMSLGRPVLAPDLPPLRDALDDGLEGRLFAARDADPPAPLTAALRALLADPALRARLGAAARRRVGERHTWQENWRRVEQALAAQNGPGPEARR